MIPKQVWMICWTFRMSYMHICHCLHVQAWLSTTLAMTLREGEGGPRVNQHHNDTNFKNSLEVSPNYSMCLSFNNTKGVYHCMDSVEWNGQKNGRNCGCVRPLTLKLICHHPLEQAEPRPQAVLSCFFNSKEPWTTLSPGPYSNMILDLGPCVVQSIAWGKLIQLCWKAGDAWACK